MKTLCFHIGAPSGHRSGHRRGTVRAPSGHRRGIAWVCLGDRSVLSAYELAQASRPPRHRPAMLAAVRRHRILQKGPDPWFGGQEPAVGPLDLQSEAAGAKRQVYLVTFPHPRAGGDLIAPTFMARADILAKLLAACAGRRVNIYGHICMAPARASATAGILMRVGACILWYARVPIHRATL